MKLILKFLSVNVLAVIFSSTSYSAVLNIDGGILLGAMDIEVDGTLYDVEFVDGTCFDIFGGCDENADFTFSNPTNSGTLLNLAMQALLDQVFVDTPQGAFDSNPALTHGCINAVECNVQTPLFISGSNGLGVTAAVNINVVDNGQVQFLDHLTSGGGTRSFDTTNGNQAGDRIVYARWTGAAAVPIPAAIWFLGSGVLGLFGMSMRNRKR